MKISDIFKISEQYWKLIMNNDIAVYTLVGLIMLFLLFVMINIF